MKEDQRIYQERIVADPRILAGKPVVKGTRIGVQGNRTSEALIT